MLSFLSLLFAWALLFVAAQNVTVDDSSDELVFSGNNTWLFIPDWENNDSVFNKTLHQSNSSASTVTFTFDGSAIYFLGTKKNDRGRVAVVMDDIPAGEIDQYSEEETKDIEVLWSMDVSPGEHTVQFGNSPSDERFSGQPYFVFDQLVYTPSSATATPGSDSSNAPLSSAPAPATSSTSAAAADVPSPTPAASIPSVSTKSSSSMSPSKVAGIVIGTLAGLALLCALLALAFRKGGDGPEQGRGDLEKGQWEFSDKCNEKYYGDFCYPAPAYSEKEPLPEPPASELPYMAASVPLPPVPIPARQSNAPSSYYANTLSRTSSFSVANPDPAANDDVNFSWLTSSRADRDLASMAGRAGHGRNDSAATWSSAGSVTSTGNVGYSGYGRQAIRAPPANGQSGRYIYGARS